MPTELEQLISLAKARNELDCERIVQIISDDITYEAQDIRHPIVGKKAVGDYLTERFKFISSLDSNIDRGLFKVAEIDKTSRTTRLCLAFVLKDEINALWLLSFDEKKLINRIFISTMYPDPKTARIVKIN